MNSGVMALRLIPCMASAPTAEGTSPSPSMMKEEKAKNTPAARAVPSTAISVRVYVVPVMAAPVVCLCMPRIERRNSETFHSSIAHIHTRAST